MCITNIKDDVVKKTILLGSILLSYSAWSVSLPNVSISFPQQPPSTVFYGETVRIPVQMTYEHLCGNKSWVLPPGSTLENVSGACPQLTEDIAYYEQGTCTMALVVKAEHFGAIEGALHYRLNSEDNSRQWEHDYYSPVFSIAAIPHPLSMALIPYQSATATINFMYPLKSAVFYYDENVAAGASPEGVVSPVEQNGLYFDPQRFAILGKPTQSGTYVFIVGAKNIYSSTAPTRLVINVGINPQDTPVFKTDYDIPSAIPGEKYSLNLLNLLEETKGFGETNQISFSIVKDGLNAGWLKISDTNSMLLEGVVHKEDAGKEVQVKLMAHSNTGGNTDPITIYIPVAADPEQKSTINYFEMEQLAGNQFFIDISNQIQDPAEDPDLKVVIDKIEPNASWLNISLLNHRALEGLIPEKVTGQKYEVTLHANTRIGGDSKSITVPLQISIDPSRTPQFKEDNPNLPILFPGQPFSYNFVENRDVYPEYEDAAYEIKFSEEHEHPTWLKLQNNRLFAEPLVPGDLDELSVDIHLVITNKPGGQSKALPLFLMVAN